jgi:FkbM family methyltransferase
LGERLLQWVLAGLAVLLSAASLTVALVIWKKQRFVFQRQHSQSETIQSVNEQLARLSASASRSEARFRLGERGESAEPRAQHGEEFILWQRSGFKQKGVFIEIGAYNGVSLSNSVFFEQLGWSGLLVEANPDLAEMCRNSRPNAVVAQAAVGLRDSGEVVFSMVRGGLGLDTLSFTSTDDRQRARIAAKGGSIEQVAVPARTLSSLVAEHGLKEVDWVSIDVEGAELEVLQGADLANFKPAVLLIEDNSAGGDKSVSDYLRQFGYRRILTVGCNDLYERTS